ncbi:MAG: MotE family protein [Candidatus Zixiibacteriota bacterium]
MADEPKAPNETEVKQSAEESQRPQKGGLAKYILFGGLFIVLIAGSALVTLMIIGEKQPQPIVAHEKMSSDETEGGATFSEAITDSLTTGDLDRSAAELMRENLSVFDYEAEDSGTGETDGNMPSGDSLAVTDRIKSKEAELAKKEEELNARQKELELLEKKLSLALLRIEKEESVRVAELAKLYDKMEANAVAQLMANLDDETIVAILPKMKPQKASSVLQLLPPQRAAVLSKRMITLAEQP